MTQDSSHDPSQTDLPAPQPCQRNVNRSKAYKALLAALGGAGAATVLAATLSAQPMTGGVTREQVTPVAAPTTRPMLTPKVLGGKPSGEQLKVTSQPATGPASAPAVEPVLKPQMLRGDVAPARLVPAPATKPVLEPVNVKGGMGAAYRINGDEA